MTWRIHWWEGPQGWLWPIPARRNQDSPLQQPMEAPQDSLCRQASCCWGTCEHVHAPRSTLHPRFVARLTANLNLLAFFCVAARVWAGTLRCALPCPSWFFCLFFLISLSVCFYLCDSDIQPQIDHPAPVEETRKEIVSKATHALSLTLSARPRPRPRPRLTSHVVARRIGPFLIYFLRADLIPCHIREGERGDLMNIPEFHLVTQPNDIPDVVTEEQVSLPLFPFFSLPSRCYLDLLSRFPTSLFLRIQGCFPTLRHRTLHLISQHQRTLLSGPASPT